MLFTHCSKIFIFPNLCDVSLYFSCAVLKLKKKEKLFGDKAHVQGLKILVHTNLFITLSFFFYIRGVIPAEEKLKLRKI